jgi:glycosyltransferase involved in cell wall biosynthesis
LVKVLGPVTVNILFVSDVSIGELIGGAERVLFEQSTRLAQRGHNVHILTRGSEGHNSNKEVIHGVRQWKYPVDQRSALLFLRSSRINSEKLFEVLCNRYNFDCINFHQPFSALGVIQSPVSKKIKKMYTCHSLSFEEFRSRNPKPKGTTRRASYFLNIQARKFMERKVLSRSDVITVLSQFTEEKLRSLHGISSEKVVIIPGGVDLQRFSPANDKTEIRRQLNIPEEKVILLTVRDLERRMGLENLIAAMSEVVKAVPDIYLTMGGNGPRRHHLTALAKSLGVENHIKFTGFISEEDLPDYYRMADLFILPTRELEGFGLVTLEAMASGVPVLGTPVGGTKEILGKFAPDLLFKDTNPDSIAALILENYRKFKENPDKWKQISLQCRQFAEQNYSWEKNIDSLEKMFTELLETGEQ